jgi:hypothetical protein
MRYLKPLALASLILIGSACGLGTTPAAASDQQATHARANATLYAMGDTGVELLRIDVDKGTVEVVGPTGVAPQSLALAIAPGWRAAYTIAQTQDATQAHLAKIDLATGAETLVGSSPLGQNLFIMGMTSSRNGVLYAAGDFTPTSPTFNSLYSIDKSTGLATHIGSFGIGSTNLDFIMSLSFDPSGHLFGASQRSIYRIDPTTGAATKVVDIVGVPLMMGKTRVMGLAFDQQGKLFASDFKDLPTGSTIYAVDLATGQFTPLIHTGIALVHNIAF